MANVLSINAANLDGKTVSVSNCPSCGGDHGKLEAEEYKTPKPPWTHWIHCPTTGDPFDIGMFDSDAHKTPSEVSREILGELSKAQLKGQYMVAIWTIEHQKAVFWRRTENFPTACMFQAVDDLRENLKQEVGAPTKAALLPADEEELKDHPRIQLFDFDPEKIGG